MVESHPGRPLRLAVLASGRGTNLLALLEARERGMLAADIAVVVSDREDAPALDHARRHGVEATHLDPGSSRARLNSEAEAAILDVLRKRRVEWVVLAGYFRILGRVLLDAYPDRILNIHPALLPSFPGLHGPRQALEYGVKVAGCTVHLVRSDVDSGPILMQAAVPVLEDDTEETLAARILEEEHRILVETVNRLSRRRFFLEGRRIRWLP